ncbi:MAG TPA: glycosyltransferase, partial [Tepidisphaeraceae bacterium]|nr:glycosyltransferase [Tepidisphaeraceae bacterium]
MKILLCWQGISGYLAACWKALAAMPGVELSILSTPSYRNFNKSVLAGLNCHVMTPEENDDAAFNKNWIQSCNPDVIVLCGWIHPIWNRLPELPEFADKPFVLAFDTPWRGTLRQRLAKWKLASLVRRMDRVIIPGERAWQYARRLGFPERKIRRGMYGIDFDALGPLYERRLAQGAGQWPRRFVYFGRYAEEKAIDVLVEAYRIYCKQAGDPWPLTTCGVGDMGKLL